jgi:hypothetical protein
MSDEVMPRDCPLTAHRSPLTNLDYAAEDAVLQRNGERGE